jgi:energy-coupling factor transport system ATP-binding protein
VDAFRSADQQALAMDSRGFATAQHRTWALPSPFSRADVVGAGGVLVLLVLPTLIGRSLG